MTVLVLGGAGFLGSHLVERLLLEGRSVVVIDDLSSGRLANLAEARRGGGELQIHQHRIGGEGTAELVDRAKPTLIYHLARVADVDDPAGALAGLVSVLKAAAASRVGRIVVGLDADALYEPSPDRRRIAESEAEQQTVSGIGERAILDALAAYRQGHAVEYVGLAIAGVYGPRMRPAAGTALVERVLDASGRGESCVLTAESLHHDLIYVDDVVDALVRAGTRGSGLLVNVGSSHAVTAEQVAWAATGAGASVTSTAESRKSPRQLVLDVNRARIHLGWRPFTELADGLQTTLAWQGQSAP